MSYNNSVSALATVDLSGLQYYAVAIGGTIAANNTAAIGILQNKPESGEEATMTYSGRSKFKAGGAIAANGRVKVTTSGFIVAVASGDGACGKALTAAASGEIVEGIFDFSNAATTY